MVFFCFRGINFINIKILWINKDLMIIIIKRYFYRVAAVVKNTFVTIKSNNYISKGIPWLILIIRWRFINFRGRNIFNKTRLTITICVTVLSNTKLKFFPDIYVHLLWKLVSQTWNKIIFCFFLIIHLSQNRHFRTVKPGII